MSSNEPIEFVYYSPEGDCLEVLLSKDAFYGKKISGGEKGLTVYYDSKTDRIVGVLVSGIKKRIEDSTP